MKYFSRFIFTCYLLIAVPGVLSAQQKLRDSLKTVLEKKNLPAGGRVLTMSRLADVISYRDISKGLKQNEEAIELARKSNSADGFSYAWSQQAVLEMREGHGTLAKQALDSALVSAGKISPLTHGIALYRKGFVQNVQNHPAQALKSWHKALPLLKKSDGALYQAGIYYLLYGIYASKTDSSKATAYAGLALKKALQSNNPGMITVAWQVKGTDYLDRYKASKDSVLLDSAVYAFKQSIETYQERNEWMKNPSAVALSALYLANIYLEYYPPWYSDDAIKNADLALRVSSAAGNVAMTANTYQIISRLNLRQANLKAARKALLKEQSLLDSLPAPNYYLSMNLYQSLAKLEAKKGHTAKELSYFKKYLADYKKVFNTRKNRTIQQLEAKYKDKLQDKKIKLLQQKSDSRKKQFQLYIGITIIAIAGLLLLFTAYHFRLKYSLQREKLKDEEASRLRAEQNLMESEKEQMQKELLAGAMQVEHKNKLLQKLKNKLSSQSEPQQLKKLERIINEEMRMDEDFENIKLELSEIHPEFFTQIQKKSPKELTRLDLKYCAYIYLKLSTKQIATLLNVKPKSVRMAKYRLKQKLELEKDVDLGTWISNFGNQL